MHCSTREEMKFERYCFPAGKNLDGFACCQVQQAFSNRVDSLYANPATRSQLAVYDRIFMPLKIFFVVVIVAIGLLLAMWRDRVDAHYRALRAGDGARPDHRRTRHAAVAGHGLWLPHHHQRHLRSSGRRAPVPA